MRKQCQQEICLWCIALYYGDTDIIIHSWNFIAHSSTNIHSKCAPVTTNPRFCQFMKQVIAPLTISLKDRKRMRSVTHTVRRLPIQEHPTLKWPVENLIQYLIGIIMLLTNWELDQFINWPQVYKEVVWLCGWFTSKTDGIQARQMVYKHAGQMVYKQDKWLNVSSEH